MDTLHSIKIFRAIVELNSFTKAAERLNISTAMASKHLTSLESYVGAKLLQRTSRRLSLTAIGKQYYHECCSALDTLEHAHQAAQQGTVLPQGELRITAPVWCATPYFAQILANYKQQYPQVVLTLNLENKHVDLVTGGYDLALRVTNQPEENLIIRKLTQIKFYLVASVNYLNHHGHPKNLEQLNQHNGILPSYLNLQFQLKKNATSDNSELILQMVLADMGIAFLPEWLIQPYLQQQRLVKLLANESVSSLNLYAAFLNRKFLSARVTTFRDFLINSFATP